MKPTPAQTHRTSWLQPMLAQLAESGLELQACLRGTGILASDLQREDRTITLQQELRFFQNLIDLSGDPTFGLRLGRLYPPQRYGLFGYAVLSAETLRHVTVISTQFGEHFTFTWLHMSFRVDGPIAYFDFSDRFDYGSVRDFFYDRDLMAGLTALEEILGRRLPLLSVALPHDGHGIRSHYEEVFRCPVKFGYAGGGYLAFPSELLDLTLPFNDVKTSQRLQQQCQLLLARIGGSGKTASEVRQLIVGRPGYFPAIEAVAEKLGCSVRSLRQRLSDEGTGYQKILDEVRFGLAREYLEQTELPLSEIAQLLGYSEPGNFTHAFKKWAQRSPSAFRRQSMHNQGGANPD